MPTTIHQRLPSGSIGRQPRSYDIDDSEEDLKRWPRLAPILRDCQTTIGVAFHKADASARRYEAFYNWLVYLAAILLAVVEFSLIMVAMPWWGRVGDSVAVSAAIVALFALVFRLHTAPSFHGLLERQKAELCRFVKFGFLISPEAWSNPSAVRQAQLSAHVEAINRLDLRDL
jgi:hypothetical protein